MNKKTIYATSGFTFVLFLAGVAFVQSDMSQGARGKMRTLLQNELVKVDPWPTDKTYDAVYILGGNQRAQRYKFSIAASIYAQNISRKILVMGDQSLTRFDSRTGRNMTFNEWSFFQLNQLAVPEADIRTIEMPEQILGTRKEAKALARFVRQQDYSSLLLIAAPYHSKRVRISFEHYLQGSGVLLVVLSSGEDVYLRHLLWEWVKLKLYEGLL